MSGEEGARKILKAKRRIQPQQVATSFSNVDWNIFFANPGFSLVANQILEFLDYDSIKTCLDVSPIWKQYIDGQKNWRLKKLFSPTPMTKFYSLYHRCNKSFIYTDYEWEKMMPYIKTKMSCSDLDILIDGFTRYGNCSLHWAVHVGNLKFVEVMIRSPYDFNTLSTFSISSDWADDLFCSTGNNVLHKAAYHGHIEIVKLILRHAKEKKIDINAKNSKGQSAINIAKDDPELVMLLMKHLDCDKTIFDEGKLGPKTLAALKEYCIDRIKKD